MLGLLATSHAPTTTNDNLSNNPYFCLGLLSNLADILIPVDSTSITLGIIYPFYPSSTSQYGIPLSALDDC